MRMAFLTAAWLTGVSATAFPQAPLDIAALTVSEPAAIAEIDTDRLKGQPSRLAWSPDGSELYLQMMEGGFGQPGARLRHYAFDAGTGRRQDLQAEPTWASAYWTAKSAQSSPDGAGRIDLKSETRTERTVSTPMGGDLARGGSSVATGTAAGDGVAAAYSRQSSLVHSMFFNGELIGEFVNSVIVPGLTFGWGPRGSRVIAFAGKSGRVVVMDDKGRRKEVERSKDALLPAWSPDASRLAWLQKNGRKNFVLDVSRVTQP